MSSQLKSIVELVNELPPASQVEVRIFIEKLLKKQAQGGPQPLKQQWAGGLSDYAEEYTSLELQKMSLEWRGNGCI